METIARKRFCKSNEYVTMQLLPSSLSPGTVWQGVIHDLDDPSLFGFVCFNSEAQMLEYFFQWQETSEEKMPHGYKHLN